MPVLLGHLFLSAGVNSTMVETRGHVPIIALSFQWFGPLVWSNIVSDILSDIILKAHDFHKPSDSSADRDTADDEAISIIGAHINCKNKLLLIPCLKVSNVNTSPGRQLVRARAVMQSSGLRRALVGLMFCCAVMKFSLFPELGASHFNFALNFRNYVARSMASFREKSMQLVPKILPISTKMAQMFMISLLKQCHDRGQKLAWHPQAKSFHIPVSFRPLLVDSDTWMGTSMSLCLYKVL